MRINSSNVTITTPASTEPPPVERHRAAVLARRHRLAPAVAAVVAALAYPEPASWAGRRA